jgi:phosphoribosylpyrophosphate synthetase
MITTDTIPLQQEKRKKSGCSTSLFAAAITGAVTRESISSLFV